MGSTWPGTRRSRSRSRRSTRLRRRAALRRRPASSCRRRSTWRCRCCSSRWSSSAAPAPSPARSWARSSSRCCPRSPAELPAVLPFISTDATEGPTSSNSRRPLRRAHHRVPDLRAARPVRDLDPNPQLLEGLALLVLSRPERRRHHDYHDEARSRCWPSCWRRARAGCRAPGVHHAETGKRGIKTDFGVTNEPCPQAIDKTKGCIYLGTISDLTVGPFAPLAVPITKAQEAFWNRVNKAGGIGGYEIDVTKYVKDNKYNPQTHNEVYQEIKPQHPGPGADAGLAARRPRSSPTSRPATSSRCRRRGPRLVGLRGRDPRVRRELLRRVDERDRLRRDASSALKNVMAVHYAGDYGDDAAAGAKYAAEKLGLTFTDVKTDPGADKQAGAIAAIVSGKPDLVILTTGSDRGRRDHRSAPRRAGLHAASSSAPARPGTRRSTAARPRPRWRRSTCSPARGSRGARTLRATRPCARR